jgi:ATP-dependent DNA helicase 2 subunit 1
VAALAFHNVQLQATAFGEEYDPDSFEDLTSPKVDMIHKVYQPVCFFLDFV